MCPVRLASLHPSSWKRCSRDSTATTAQSSVDHAEASCPDAGTLLHPGRGRRGSVSGQVPAPTFFGAMTSLRSPLAAHSSARLDTLRAATPPRRVLSG